MYGTLFLKFQRKLKALTKLGDAFTFAGYIFRVHNGIRLRPVFEKTSFECEDYFSPIQKACYLDNSRVFVARGIELAVAWQCRTSKLCR